MHRKDRILAELGALTVAQAVVFGLLSSPGACAQSSPTATTSASSFEVASIKANHSGTQLSRLMFAPDGFSASGLSLKALIDYAYNVKDFQISGGPGWIDSEKFDVEAKMDESTITALKKLSPDEAGNERRRMMQSLLEERFNLKVSRSTKELPIYALVVAKNGPKLTKSADSPPSGSAGPGGKSIMRIMQIGELTATGIPMSALVDRLAREVGRPVVDKTGLEGRYDFTLKWASDRQGPGARPADNQGPAPPVDTSGPSIFTAVQEQLGLKLESEKGPVETLIIESVERPSED